MIFEKAGRGVRPIVDLGGQGGGGGLDLPFLADIIFGYFLAVVSSSPTDRKPPRNSWIIQLLSFRHDKSLHRLNEAI